MTDDDLEEKRANDPQAQVNGLLREARHRIYWAAGMLAKQGHSALADDLRVVAKRTLEVSRLAQLEPSAAAVLSDPNATIGAKKRAKQS